MKHVYLGILFVMNCFWADLCREMRNGKEVRADRNKQGKNLNEKCHQYMSLYLWFVFPPPFLNMTVTAYAVLWTVTCYLNLPVSKHRFTLSHPFFQAQLRSLSDLPTFQSSVPCETRHTHKHKLGCRLSFLPLKRVYLYTLQAWNCNILSLHEVSKMICQSADIMHMEYDT